MIQHSAYFQGKKVSGEIHGRTFVSSRPEVPLAAVLQRLSSTCESRTFKSETDFPLGFGYNYQICILKEMHIFCESTTSDSSRIKRLSTQWLVLLLSAACRRIILGPILVARVQLKLTSDSRPDLPNSCFHKFRKAPWDPRVVRSFIWCKTEGRIRFHQEFWWFIHGSKICIRPP